MNLASVRIEVEEVEQGKKYRGKVTLEDQEFPYILEFHKNLETYMQFPFPINGDDIEDAFDLEVFSKDGKPLQVDGNDRAFFEYTTVDKAVSFYEHERRKEITGAAPVKKATSNLAFPMREHLDDLINRSRNGLM